MREVKVEHNNQTANWLWDEDSKRYTTQATHSFNIIIMSLIIIILNLNAYTCINRSYICLVRCLCNITMAKQTNHLKQEFQNVIQKYKTLWLTAHQISV